MTQDALRSRTLHALFERAANSRHDSVLFADERERYTGEQALSVVTALSLGYADLGLGAGDRVAFMTGGSARHSLSYFGCHRIGAVPCALHLREPVNRLAEAINWLEAGAIVCDAEREPIAHAALEAVGVTIPIVCLDDDTSLPREATFSGLAEAAGKAERTLVTPPGEDDLGMIVMSSGTTGAPKGTLNQQRTLRATADAGHAVFGEIRQDAAVLVAVAPSAAAWIHIVLPFVAGGAAIHFIRRFDPRAYVETLIRERITHAPIVPTMWRMVLAAVERDDDVSALDLAFFAGEVGDAELVAQLKAVLPGARIRTGYLSAEGGCASACVADESTLIDAMKPSSTGRPVAGCDLRFVDPQGSINDLVPLGSEGEIVLRSASIASGYWKEPELTPRRFVDGWWRSGDMGRVDEDGDLFIVGRTDNVINSGGLKVHAEEVEAALLQHPSVTLAAVVAEPDPQWGQVVVAHVVCAEATSGNEILAFLREQNLLSNVKVPKRVYIHDELPIGPTGKLDRRSLTNGTRPSGAPTPYRA